MRNKENVLREQVNRLGRPSLEQLDREAVRLGRVDGYRRLCGSFIVSLVAVAAVIVLVTNLWVTVLRIDGSSMNPLFQMNEIVVAVHTASPAKGSAAAFYQNNQLHVKRVIAMAGDTVEIDEEGAVTVNGRALDEPYVEQPSRSSCDIDFPFRVPDGMVFVMGDNRPLSLDSRHSSFGTVYKDQIVGRVLFRVWPLSRLGKIN
ncbi:MAG: signal peptidase I [Oscillospiraceae bacterium]|nr:signal peptidase I [Oscillospiraceae bacterium]